MNRTLNVVRMQLINKQTYIWIPLHHPRRRVRPRARGLRDPRRLRMPGPVLRRRRAGAAVVLRHRRHPGAHPHVPVLAGDERHPARVLPRHAPHRGAHLRDPRGHRRASAASSSRRRDGWGMNGCFFGLPWIWEDGPVGAFLVNFVDRDAVLRDRVLGRHDLQALRRARGSRSCSSGSGRCFVVGAVGRRPLGRLGRGVRTGSARRASSGSRCGGSCWPRARGASFLTLRRAVP